MSGWKVVCSNYWKTITFTFDSLEEAGQFLSVFTEHKDPDADKLATVGAEDGRKWTYCIEPVEPEEDTEDGED